MSTPRTLPRSMSWHQDWKTTGDLVLISSDEIAFSVPSAPILASSHSAPLREAEQPPPSLRAYSSSPTLRPDQHTFLRIPLSARLVSYFLDLALYGQLDLTGSAESWLTDVLSLAEWLNSVGATQLVNLLLVSGRAQRWPLGVEFLLGAKLRRTDLCVGALDRFNYDCRWADTPWQPPGTVSAFATLCPRALPFELYSSIDRRFMWAWFVTDVPDNPPSFGLGEKFLEIYQTP